MIPTRRVSSLNQISPSTPVFQTTQASSTHFGGLEAKANVGAAGSAIQDAQVVGQAQIKLAEANAQVGQAIYNTGVKLFDLAHKKTLKDEERETRSQLNTFSDGSRKILGNLSSLSGQQRVDAAPEARQQLEDLQDQISKLSSNRRVQDGFMAASSVRLGGHLDTIGAGSLKAKNEAIANTNRLAIFTAKEEVVADPSVNSVQISTANAVIAAGEGLRAQGETDPRVIRAAQQAVINDIYSTAISGVLANGNVGRAQDMYNNVGEYSGKDVPVLTGEARIKMGNLLKDQVATTRVAITALSIRNSKEYTTQEDQLRRADELLVNGKLSGTEHSGVTARIRQSWVDKGTVRKENNRLNLASQARGYVKNVYDMVGDNESDALAYVRKHLTNLPPDEYKAVEALIKVRGQEKRTQVRVEGRAAVGRITAAIQQGWVEKVDGEGNKVKVPINTLTDVYEHMSKEIGSALSTGIQGLPTTFENQMKAKLRRGLPNPPVTGAEGKKVLRQILAVSTAIGSKPIGALDTGEGGEIQLTFQEVLNLDDNYLNTILSTSDAARVQTHRNRLVTNAHKNTEYLRRQATNAINSLRTRSAGIKNVRSGKGQSEGKLFNFNSDVATKIEAEVHGIIADRILEGVGPGSISDTLDAIPGDIPKGFPDADWVRTQAAAVAMRYMATSDPPGWLAASDREWNDISQPIRNASAAQRAHAVVSYDRIPIFFRENIEEQLRDEKGTVTEDIVSRIAGALAAHDRPRVMRLFQEAIAAAKAAEAADKAAAATPGKVVDPDLGLIPQMFQ